MVALRLLLPLALLPWSRGLQRAEPQEEPLGEAQQSLPEPPRVAVCLAGQLRSFLEAEVQTGFHSNFHHPGYEYFLSTDTGVDANLTQLQGLVRSVHVGSSPPDPLLSGDCPRGFMMHRNLRPMVHRYIACFHDMEAEEAARGFRYAYVLRARPDHYFTAPFPHVTELLAKYAPGKDVLLLDDHMAATSREHASSVLVTPFQAYSECHDAVAWSKACGKPVGDLRTRSTKRTPCCPMLMIGVYDTSLTIRGYEFKENPLPDCVVKVKRYHEGSKCYWR